MGNNGTPKTLVEAINNGLNNIVEEKIDFTKNVFADEVIERHVKDYLAQAFNVAELKGMTVMELWAYLNAGKK